MSLSKCLLLLFLGSSRSEKQSLSPFAEAYLYSCVRYVERNPVRAGMVKHAEDYWWSSAPAYCGLKDDPLLTRDSPHWQPFQTITDRSAWLHQTDNTEHLNTLRRHIQKNLLCGSEQFIE